MEFIKDLYKRPTFVSILGLLIFIIIIPIMILQILDGLQGGASLGLVIEIIFLLIVFAIISVDRFILADFNRKKVSIIEAILIIGFLIYYFISHNNSFSVG